MAKLIISKALQRELTGQHAITHLAEAARAWRHGNFSTQQLIEAVDEFEGGMPDASIDLTEGLGRG